MKDSPSDPPPPPPGDDDLTPTLAKFGESCDRDLELLKEQRPPGLWEAIDSLLGPPSRILSGGDHHLAADFRQEAALRALAHDLTHVANLTAWLRKILINVVREYWRNSPKRGQQDVDDQIAMEIDGARTPSQLMIDKEQLKIINDKFAQLSEPHQEILRLSLEVDHAELSKLLNLSEGTTRSRLWWARKRLRDLLDGQ